MKPKNLRSRDELRLIVKRERKYKNIPTVVDGWRFDSQKEARYYQMLKAAVSSGELLYFLRQVPFHLPGHIIYRVDFVEFYRNGEVRYVDTNNINIVTASGGVWTIAGEITTGSYKIIVKRTGGVS